MDFSKLVTKFSELITGKTIVVPAYQRAFAWGDNLIKLFIADLQKCHTKGITYYYGHFIMEELEDKREVIDGQQRLTLAALFITYCHKVHDIQPDNHLLTFAQSFETVSYDQDLYLQIQQDLGTKSLEQIAKEIKEYPKATLSLQRLLQALKVLDDKLGTLDKAKLQAYLTILAQAEVSKHFVYNKAVAVQMFELHNTRGISLTLMDKVKAKLMQFVYEHGGDSREDYVQQVQAQFAKVYAMEQDLKAASFRGDLSLQELFFYHLRMVDDGNSANFTQPGQNNEESIIDSYLVSRLEKEQESTTYALTLAEKFAESVRFFSEDLPKLDREVSDLVGDVLVLDKAKSTELFLLIYHNKGKINAEQLQLWEKLLFTQDFHDLYYRKQYREDFPRLYKELKQILVDPNTELDREEAITDRLKYYVQNGFRYDTEGLQYIVYKHLIKHQYNILYGAYHFWRNKMRYLLYKYEKSNGVDLRQLREVMKEGAALEHILPREWEWEWIKNCCKSDEEQNRFNQDIREYLNGIGNLLLLSQSENSTHGNKKPAEKEYSINGSSYQIHNENKERWKKPEQWIDLIQERGNKVVDFLFTYFFAAPYKPWQQSKQKIEELSTKLDTKNSNIELRSWGHMGYFFEVGLPQKDDSQTHMRVYIIASPPKHDDFKIYAGFFYKRITGENKQKEEAVKVIKETMDLDEKDDEWSKPYSIDEMDRFVKDLQLVIEKLKEAGFKPLPEA